MTYHNIYLVNGVEEDLSKYRKLIGFVPQEGLSNFRQKKSLLYKAKSLFCLDVMLRELTVREILVVITLKV